MNTEGIMPHVLLFETVMKVQRFMPLLESEKAVMVHLHWSGLLKSEDTDEPI